MPLSPLDTFDYEPIELDLGNLLSTGETIATVNLIVPATAAAAGILVDTETNPVEIINGFSSAKPSGGVKFWLMCEADNQEDAAFSPKLDVRLGIRLVLSTGRKLERYVPVTFQREIALTEA